ncbi:hypothetical protein ACFQZC_07880 [Streptacidiphilus monticola]
MVSTRTAVVLACLATGLIGSCFVASGLLGRYPVLGGRGCATASPPSSSGPPPHGPGGGSLRCGACRRACTGGSRCSPPPGWWASTPPCWPPSGRPSRPSRACWSAARRWSSR